MPVILPVSPASDVSSILKTSPLRDIIVFHVPEGVAVSPQSSQLPLPLIVMALLTLTDELNVCVPL
jgi:hypothetical protein